MSQANFIVIAGPDKGREISIDGESARVGRSSTNDIVLRDPSLSRFQCRFSFRSGSELWVSDLGASNSTLVNGAEIQEQRLKVGDVVALGSSELKVTSESPPGAAPAEAEAPVATGSPDLFGSRGDHGRDAGTGSPQPSKPVNRRAMLWGITAAAIIVMLAIASLNRGGRDARPEPSPTTTTPVTPAATEPARILEISYEKVHASLDNIFRYAMTLNDGVIAIEIDNLENNQHIRKEDAVADSTLRSLAESIQGTGFFELQDRYIGRQPTDHDAWDLTITIGRNTHRTRVQDRLEPDGFSETRELIEEFGKNQLGLAAIALPPEQLIALARDATLMGKKFYNERNIEIGNLWKSIKKFGEAEWYLESIEPKPEFYVDAVTGRKEAERELDTRHEELMFLANKAAHNREWENASLNLETARDLIPDRSDKRYKAADKMLLDITHRMEEME